MDIEGSGYIASWLVKLLLQRGYTVKASVRDPNNPKKVDHLLKLDGAKERLHLFKANLLEEGSFDAAVVGCEGVFHTASPFYHAVTDPQIPGWSGLSNARVTIFGDVYPLPEDQQEWAHKQYISKHQQGPSQQWGNFYYFRMQNISDIYFIGGFGTVAWVNVNACENECVLFWDEHKDASQCPTCGTSRWKKNSKTVPRKVVWYFPPIPRFRRMFSSPETAHALTWKGR